MHGMQAVSYTHLVLPPLRLLRTISTFGLCLRAVVIISFSLLLVPVTVVSVLIISVTVEAGEACLLYTSGTDFTGRRLETSD